MAKNYIIDATTARDLIRVLQLRGEIGEKEIKWALSIIHQIPGYEKISIARAAIDKSLRGVLVAIASEEIAPTNPKDLENLLEEAKKREAAGKAASAEGEKKAKDFVKGATPKETVKATPPKEEVKVAPPKEVKVEVKPSQVEVIKSPTPLSAEPESPSIGVRITPSLFQAVSGLAKKTVLAPITLPVNYFLKAGASAVYSSAEGDTKGQSSLSPFVLRTYGVNSRHLKTAVSSAFEAGKISEETSKKLLEVAKAIKNVESGSPWYIKTVFWAYGGNQVSLVTDLDKISGGAPLRNFLMAPTDQGFGVFIKDAAGEIGQRAIGGIVKKGAINLLGKLGISLGEKAGAAALGGPAGPVIAAALFIKDIASWIKRFIQKNKGLFFAAFAAGLMGLGFVLGNTPLMVFGGAGVGLGVASSLGASPGTVLSSAANGISGAIVGLTSLTIASLSASAVVALVALPAVIAIILFIINSGAYIVPPRVAIATLGAVESPYIGVEKTVDGESEFSNEDLAFPKGVTYIITVSAKKGTLSNIKFQYGCEVVQEKSKKACPGVEIPSPPTIISPVENFTFSYTHQLDSGFRDAFVLDTMTVTADSPDAKGSVSVASASVKIGNPPDDCPSRWPVNREGGEPPIPIKQGPHTSGGTHDVIEAADISVTVGHQVKATHTGVVTVGNYGNYGNFVDVTSTCQTKTPPSKAVSITTRYAHLGTINVRTGQSVSLGQPIGTSDTSGTTDPHLHYEFRPDGSLPMIGPYYVPTTIPPGCTDFDGNPGNNCGVFISN